MLKIRIADWRNVVKAIRGVFVAVMLGVLLMTVAYLIPLDEKIVSDSHTFANQQGAHPEYPLISHQRASYFHSYLPGVFDGGTMMLEVDLLTAQRSGSALQAAMIPTYARYWHGYISILRPLMLFWDYEQLQMVNAFMQLLFVFFLAHAIGEKLGKRVLWVYGISLVLLCYPVVSICFQYTWIFWIAYGAVFIYLKKKEWFAKEGRAELFFTFLGVLTSYLDLLTYPLYTWAIPLLYMILDQKEKTAAENIRKVIATGLFWVIGYGGMWAGKWACASAILGENIFLNAAQAVDFRSSSETGMLYRLIALNRNWQHYSYNLYLIILVVIVVYWLCKGLLQGCNKDCRVYSIFLVGVSAIAWYLVLAEHTYVHHHFTYRIFGIAVTAFMALVLVSTKEEKIRIVKEQWASKRLCKCVFFLMGVLSLTMISVAFSFEESEVQNYGTPGCELVEYKGAIEYKFTAAYPKVTKYKAVFNREDGTEGKLAVLVYDEEKLLYEEVHLLSEFEGSIMEILVDWNLKKGKEYRVVTELRDYSGYADYPITPEDALPVEGECMLDAEGNSLSQQLCHGIIYFCRPFSVEQKFFYAITWLGVWSAFFYMGYCVISGKTGITWKMKKREIA